MDILATNNVTQKFLSIVEALNGKMMKNEPTRLSSTSATYLDNIIINISDDLFASAINEHISAISEGPEILFSTFFKYYKRYTAGYDSTIRTWLPQTQNKIPNIYFFIKTKQESL
ncbi:hypothetical protein WA026_007997 [Henosepilachna vigintioctopunctata]|uniref:Uncharacterized protein n=1 Tax=Henosepilachna vigintioctopunctata TaxID=420089 RepID=A0AAW1TQM1_9CUCU